MASTNETSLGLNQWAASDKPVRQDFVKDNAIINDNLIKANNEITKLNNWLLNGNFKAFTVTHNPLKLDGVACNGNTQIAWISIGSNTNRRMFIGAVTDTEDPQVWEKYVANPKIVFRNYIDGRYSAIRTL